jgi:hypothetical protein
VPLDPKTRLCLAHLNRWLAEQWNPTIARLQPIGEYNDLLYTIGTDRHLYVIERIAKVDQEFGAMTTGEQIMTRVKTVFMESTFALDMRGGYQNKLEILLERRIPDGAAALERLEPESKFYFWLCEAREIVNDDRHRPNLPRSLGELFMHSEERVLHYIRRAHQVIRKP